MVSVRRTVRSRLPLRSALRVLTGYDRSLMVAGLAENREDSSDHAAFNEAGIPNLYFGFAEHDDYHAPSDSFEHINQAFFGRVANLVVDVAALMERDLDKIAP